jgi:hypothetical protein
MLPELSIFDSRFVDGRESHGATLGAMLPRQAGFGFAGAMSEERGHSGSGVPSFSTFAGPTAAGECFYPPKGGGIIHCVLCG